MANNDGKELTGHITIDKDRFPVDSAIYMGPKTLMTVEYCGNYIYRNGKLERVLNDYGYYADGAYHFNITDYQGNIRAVIREDGTLEETSSYYPYGGLMGSGSMGVQPYKYGGKELDRENGLDLYDSHARMYDPIIGRTTTIDPLAEKYTHLSPYLWCAANPLKYVDPSGKKLRFAKGTTLPFVVNFYTATLFMKQNGTFDNIQKIIDSPNVYYIADGSQFFKPNQFNGIKKTIFWNPNVGLITTKNKLLSPATMLDHEFQHCVNYEVDKNKYINQIDIENEVYTTEEEKSVIENRERQTAIKHNEINNNEKTREDHFGQEFYTRTPSSTTIVTDIDYIFRTGKMLLTRNKNKLKQYRSNHN